MPYITGLKGYAALGIMVFHYSYIFRSIPTAIYPLLISGSSMIYVFFGISAYTLAYSIASSNRFRYVDYLKRRVIRIVPSYYLMLIVGILLQIFLFKYQNLARLLKTFITQVLFLNTNLVSPGFETAILFVEWMLPIMFGYYLIFPILYTSIRKNPLIYPVLLLVSYYLYFNPKLILTYGGQGGFNWSMQRYLHLYSILIGYYFKEDIIRYIRNSSAFVRVTYILLLMMCCLSVCIYAYSNVERIYIFVLLSLNIFKYHQSKYVFGERTIAEYAWAIITIVLFLMYAYNYFSFPHADVVISYWLVLFLQVARKNSLIKIVFANGPILFIGSISYEIYLLHVLLKNIAEKVQLSSNQYLLTVTIVVVTFGCAYFLNRISSTIVSNLNIGSNRRKPYPI